MTVRPVTALAPERGNGVVHISSGPRAGKRSALVRELADALAAGVVPDGAFTGPAGRRLLEDARAELERRRAA